jgi:molybdenum cofactor cytidylyltransferase
MNIGAVVLAAEKSDWIGQNKQLLRLNGKTLLESILDALSEAGINEQVIVLGNEMAEVIEAIRPKLGKIKIALNVAPERGMASSVQTGIIVLSNVDAIFIVLGYQPILDSSLLRKMIKTLGGNSETLIVSPIHNEKEGHPLLFRKSLFGELISLRDNQSIRDVVHAHADKVINVEAPQWSIMDIDTPEDYKRMQAEYKSG